MIDQSVILKEVKEGIKALVKKISNSKVDKINEILTNATEEEKIKLLYMELKKITKLDYDDFEHKEINEFIIQRFFLILKSYTGR